MCMAVNFCSVDASDDISRFKRFLQLNEMTVIENSLPFNFLDKRLEAKLVSSNEFIFDSFT